MDRVLLRVTSADATRERIDPVLDSLAGRRLVIDADLAGLVAVLARLSRRGELGTVETAVLPHSPVPFLSRLGVTPQSASVLVDAPVRAVGVVKDDSGGLFVSSAALAPWSGSGLWCRAYVDDRCLCDGTVRSLSITRGGRDELVATVRTRWRRRTVRGRAVQLACDPAAVSSDGVRRERPRRKRTWWGEPEHWLLALPPSR